MKSFYRKSKACVRAGTEDEEYFPVKTGLRQGCVMCSWLLNIFMDEVVGKVNARFREHRTRMIYSGERKWEVSVFTFVCR